MAIFHLAGHLPQAHLALQQAHFPVREDVGENPSVPTSSMFAKAFSSDMRKAALAVGEQIEVGRPDLLEELGAIAAAIKHDCDAPLANQQADLLQDAGEHFHQTGVGLGRDDEQRVAGCVVDPVVGGGWHREAHLRHMRLWQAIFAVVNADMTIHVEKAQDGTAMGHALLGQSTTELGGPSVCGQASQLAP